MLKKSRRFRYQDDDISHNVLVSSHDLDIQCTVHTYWMQISGDGDGDRQTSVQRPETTKKLKRSHQKHSQKIRHCAGYGVIQSYRIFGSRTVALHHSLPERLENPDITDFESLKSNNANSLLLIPRYGIVVRQLWKALTRTASQAFLVSR